MSDLVAFLRARLDEDEAAAARGSALRQKLDDPYRQMDRDIRDGAEYAWHEAAVDPARVLREVEAKRLLLTEFAGARLAFQQASREARPDPRRDNARCAAYDARLAALSAHYQAAQRIVLAGVAVYRDHPDYDPAWAGEK